MGYEREENAGFLQRKALEFTRNVVKNFKYENVEDEDFFRIFKLAKPESKLAADLQACLPEGIAAKYLEQENTDRRIPAASFGESGRVVKLLRHFFNDCTTCNDVQKMLVNVANTYLESMPNDTASPERERFETLAKLLKLSPLEADAVMLSCLFSWGYLRKDFDGNRRFKTFNNSVRRFALHLDARPAEVRELMSEEGKLRRLHCLDDDFEAPVNIIDFLEGIGKTPLANRFFTPCDGETLPWAYFGTLAEKHGASLKDMLANRAPGQGIHILLYGQPGTGKSSFAVALAKELGFSCTKIVQNVKSERTDKTDSSKELRFAALQICAAQLAPEKNIILIDEADEMLRGVAFGGEIKGDKGMVNTVLEDIKIPCIWITNTSSCELDASTRRRFDYSIRFEKLTAAQRHQIWRNAAERFGLTECIPTSLVDKLARKYEVSAGGISIVLKNVKNLLPENAAPDAVESLVETFMRPHCELLSVKPRNERFDVAKDYSLEGVNYTSEIPLTRIEAAMRRFFNAEDVSCSLLMQDSPRMNLLLSGPPGTGKTEFVKYLAKTLDTRVVLKMGSDLLDCWVGGTEQRIVSAFKEAENEKAILFMDEIDGMLQSRGRAQRSWEVTQVNELLHQMENFKGVFIGATNFFDNLDPAVLRRFTFKITLDYLSDEGKFLFFERMFGASLTDLEKSRLARIPNLAPGDFRTVRQSFYYLGGETTNGDLLAALARESEVKQQGKTTKIGF